MKNLKSHLRFTNQQRGGILALLLLVFGLLCVLFFVDFSSEERLDLDSPEVLVLQKQLDSVRLIVIENRKPKKYPFNPNYITDYKGYTLGLSSEEIDRLLAFRSEGKWVNSVSDFQIVTKVSDSLLAEISPYFKFPDWVTNPKVSKAKFIDYKNKKFTGPKTDLNTATQEQLIEVSGIGEALSLRIINYRDKLGGFSDDVQLYNVFGLDPTVVQKALERFTVKTPKPIQKININKASASDIATITGISFELAKKIWEYRKLRDKLNSLDELQNVEGLTPKKFAEIKLYLSID